VEVPKNLSKEQKELFEKLAAIESMMNLSNQIMESFSCK